MSIPQLLSDILEYYVDKHHLPVVNLKFGRCQRTHYHDNGWSITVRAFWHRPEELAIANLLHAVAHIIQQAKQTHRSFASIEQTLLTDFGLAPVRYNERTCRYSILQTINGDHQWIRAAAWNRNDLICGTF